MDSNLRQMHSRNLTAWEQTSPLLDMAGWKLFLSATRDVRDLTVRGIVSKVDSHPEMCKRAGVIKALDDVLTWTDKVRLNAEVARRWFDEHGDSSSDDE